MHPRCMQSKTIPVYAMCFSGCCLALSTTAPPLAKLLGTSDDMCCLMCLILCNVFSFLQETKTCAYDSCMVLRHVVEMCGVPSCPGCALIALWPADRLMFQLCLLVVLPPTQAHAYVFRLLSQQYCEISCCTSSPDQLPMICLRGFAPQGRSGQVGFGWFDRFGLAGTLWFRRLRLV